MTTEVMTTVANEVVINKATRSDLLHIDPRAIRVIDGFNPRQDYGDIESLSLSIAENGVKNPLSGYKKVVDGVELYYLTDGHRRLQATMMAIENGTEIARVPFKLEAKTYSDVERLCDTILKNDGKNLTQYEMASVFNKLVENYGWSTNEVAKKFGKHQSYVSNTIALLTLPEEIQTNIASGEISATTAVNIVRNVGDEEQAVEVVKETIQNAKEKGKKKATDKDIKAKELVAKNDAEIVKKALRGMIMTMTENGMIDDQTDFFDKISNIYENMLQGNTLSDSMLNS